jgi:hypothetical protein
LEEIFRTRIYETDAIIGIDDENGIGQGIKNSRRAGQDSRIAISSKHRIAHYQAARASFSSAIA